jgi:glycosyltransferase involved in cell wall biosynthesis
MPKTHIIFTVTNDLSYDQRMQRICSTLAEAGYEVTLVGRELPDSRPLLPQRFEQHRLGCRFRKGFLFYAEYNVRLLRYLLMASYDVLCSIDYDTLPGGGVAALLRGRKRVFDAHEYFTEVPEVVHRPLVRFFWAAIAHVFLPFYHRAYTVGPSLAAIFQKKFGLPFEVIRNVPLPSPVVPTAAWEPGRRRILLYQGALNEGRGIECLLAAMQHIEGAELWLAGEGDLSEALRAKCNALGVQQKVRFLGFVPPNDLKALTQRAFLGLNLLENRGLSYYYSLANKFFDYVQAAVPVVTMRFPEYEALCRQHEVALLLDQLTEQDLVQTLQQLLHDAALYERLRENCLKARAVWNWDQEKHTLIRLYDTL